MDFETLIQFDKQLLLLLNGSDSLFLDGLVMTLTTAATWIPLYVALFYVVLRNNESVVRILLILAAAGLCVLLAGSVDDMLVKPLVARWRPGHDPEIGLLVDTVNGYRGGKYGFFSAHASNTFSIAVFFSLLLRDRKLTVALVLWSLVNCWTRMYLGVHYPGDITVGLLWGALVGWSVYRLFVWCSAWSVERGARCEVRGADSYIVILVLLLTLIYAMIRSCFRMDM